MCGIAGIIGTRAVNAHAVKAMTDLMAHRGPDGEGIWISPDHRVCFGHRRLAIIDVSDHGAQPMHSPDTTLTITYNGEIYNYRELQSELKALGVSFSTESDTEVLLAAYRQWGEACLQKLNGMFAFAIHDSVRKVIFCARDRFGEKPLLFVQKDGFVAFASEYKALLTLQGIGAEIDDERLMRFFVDTSSSLDQERDSVFRDIRQLRGGEKLLIDLQTLSCHLESYWQAPQTGQSRTVSPDDAAQHFRALLEDSVKLRMRSDVPLGSCLSGGLDSSSITCIARAHAGRTNPYHVFTGRFPDTEADEGAWARMVVDATGADQHETFPDGDGLIEDLDAFIWMNELPVDSASQYAQWCVFKLARENGVTVLLDGQGSDEILGGYEQYFANYIISRTQAGKLDDSEKAAIETRYPMALSMQRNRWKTAMPFALRNGLAHLLGRGSSVLFGMNGQWASSVAAKGEPADVQLPLLEALQKDACNGFLATLLRYGDRNSMAHSREVRLPFCDHRILEFVMTLPVEHLMGDAETKHLLRTAMQGVVPEGVRTRWLKQGFQPPISHWLTGSLGALANDVFSSPAFASSCYWDAGWWQKALTRFRGGEKNMASTIWKPMICQLWQERFVARARALPAISPFA